METNNLKKEGAKSSNEFNYKEIVKELKEVAIKEFFEICKCPHATFSLKKIQQYLKDRIKHLGHQAETDTYGNMWFDIPGSAGCENWPKVIIQGHMDMVYAGPTPDQPIIPVMETIFDQNTETKQLVIHSKNYETSLGADDGIGIATMFAICQNKSLKHGPIRFIITADEECGGEGAAHLPDEVLDCNNLINVDGELNCGLAISCYGSTSWYFDAKFKPTNKDIKQNIFELTVSNLHGGHSGEDIGFGYANAERIAFEILSRSNVDGKTIQLIEINHRDDAGKELTYQTNALIRNTRVVFATDLTTSNIERVVNNLMWTFKHKYFGEKWESVVIKVLDVKSNYPFKAAYNVEDSDKIINFMGGSEGLNFGLINILDKENHVPGASSNIGPTSFNAGASKDNDKFSTKSLARSYLKSDMLTFCGLGENVEQVNVHRSFKDIWNLVMKNVDGQIRNFSTKLAWESNASNKIRDLLIDGYRKAAKKEPKLVSLYGVLEQSAFVPKKPKMNMITVGPYIKNCHTQNETLYVDSMDAEFNALVYALSHYNSITNE